MQVSWGTTASFKLESLSESNISASARRAFELSECIIQCIGSLQKVTYNYETRTRKQFHLVAGIKGNWPECGSCLKPHLLDLEASGICRCFNFHFWQEVPVSKLPCAAFTGTAVSNIPRRIDLQVWSLGRAWLCSGLSSGCVSSLHS